jgi:hypothetical protein
MNMRILNVAALCGGILLAAGAVSAADSKPAAAAAKTQNAVVLPKEAVAISPGTYTYTDPQGKKWIFRQTPFGMAKFEDIDRPATDAEAQQKQVADMRAVEDGEFIRFERPGPFGIYRWKQKKTELDAIEQAAWDRARGQQPSGRDKE